MSNVDEKKCTDPVVGMAVEEAVEHILTREADADRSSIRAALDLVAEDGIISQDAIKSSLAQTAKYVATPETRLEIAGKTLETAREAATPASALETVGSRLGEFEKRYLEIETEVADLGTRLNELEVRAGAPRDVYELSQSLRKVRSDARDVQCRADELTFDLEEFESWVTDPETRFDCLADETTAVGGLLDDVTTTIERIEPTMDHHGDSRGIRTDDFAQAWADAELHRQVIGLLIADLRAELADLRAWPDTDAVLTNRATELEARIEALRSRKTDLGDLLDEIAPPGSRARFDDQIVNFEAELEALTHPVDWGTVNDMLEEYRTRILDESSE